MVSFIVVLIIVIIAVVISVKKSEEQKKASQKKAQEPDLFARREAQNTKDRQSVPQKHHTYQKPEKEKTIYEKRLQRESIERKVVEAEARLERGEPEIAAVIKETADSSRDMDIQQIMRGAGGKRESNARYVKKDIIDPGNLMEQVRDAMVMGVSSKLSYERDFVGEGIEMLAGYEKLQQEG